MSAFFVHLYTLQYYVILYDDNKQDPDGTV